MIEINTDFDSNIQVVAKFGEGTLGIKGCVFTDESNNLKGVLEFNTINKQEVGEGFTNHNQEFMNNVPYHPIVLEFSNIEGLDVLIKSLEDIKASMVNK